MNEKKQIDLENKTILVTGSPGFIGANLVMRLLHVMDSGSVISFDNMNAYYDPALKEYRLSKIEEEAAAVANQATRDGTSCPQHVFIQGDLSDRAAVDKAFAKWQPDIVINLAAQAGVRYSIDHPQTYIQSNIVGFMNVLEACRNHPVEHLVYASSSSVYGNNNATPFSTEDKTDTPVSLYAATKKSNELLAYSYAKLYNIPCTGLRFFTVYGPAGRPDMFYYSATEKLLRGDSIKLFNYGNCARDFTYVDDIVEGILRIMQGAPKQEDGLDGLPIAPFALYNIGAGAPVDLMEFVRILQEELVAAELLPADYDFQAHQELVPMQPGDVAVTYADTKALEADFGYAPSTGLREGLRRFVAWYKEWQYHFR